MSAFENIIGYENVKRELHRVADMIKNPGKYHALGAKLPKGMILHGAPGVGKTMIAKAFIEETGVKSAVIRHEKSRDSFCDYIKQIFETLAVEDEPSVILLDDLDKFSMEEDNGEEFAVVQACIDSVKDKNVFIIATANNIGALPISLVRPGRFDRNIKISYPEGEDAVKIITHFMEGVKVADDINYEDIAKMLTKRSCATLENVINTAAIEAAYENKESIEMENFVNATLFDVYGLENRCGEMSPEMREEIAYHEAGHAVICEVLTPESVGMVSLSGNIFSRSSGFMLRCKNPERRGYEVLVSLGGKAACEMKFGKIASGTGSDLDDARALLVDGVSGTATAGLSNIDVTMPISESHLQARERIVGAELERYLFKAKEIIACNRDFLEKVTKELLEKNTLLYSDIKRIRESCTVTPAVVG